MNIDIGKGRPAPAFGLAGNSRHSDWEYPATITFEDGSTISDVFSTGEGARYWAQRWATNLEERKQHGGYKPAQ